MHAFTSELNKAGAKARLWYWDIQSYPPMPDEYKAYNCEYVTELPQDFDGIVVLPEIWANKALDFPKAAIYWLGLDAYAGWHPANRGAFLANENIIHIAQSEYAYDLLRKLKVNKLRDCSQGLSASSGYWSILHSTITSATRFEISLLRSTTPGRNIVESVSNSKDDERSELIRSCVIHGFCSPGCTIASSRVKTE